MRVILGRVEKVSISWSTGNLHYFGGLLKKINYRITSKK